MATLVCMFFFSVGFDGRKAVCVLFLNLTKPMLFEKYDCVVTSEYLQNQCCLNSLCIGLNPTFYCNFR